MSAIAPAFAEGTAPQARQSIIDPDSFLPRGVQVLAEPEILLPGDSTHVEVPDSSYSDMSVIGLAVHHRALGVYVLERLKKGSSFDEPRDSVLQISPAGLKFTAELPDDVSLEFDHISRLNYPPDYGVMRFNTYPVLNVSSYRRLGRSIFNLQNTQPDHVWHGHQPLVVAPVRYTRDLSKSYGIDIGL